MDDSANPIVKLHTSKLRPNNRTYIKDGDLQIQGPQLRETSDLENAMAFKTIYTHYMNQVAKGRAESAAEPAKLRDEVQAEMHDAETAFNSMMEIRKTIEDSYHEFMQKQ